MSARGTARGRRGRRQPLRALERWLLGRDLVSPIVRCLLVWGAFASYWVVLAALRAERGLPLPSWLAWAPFPLDGLISTAGLLFQPRVLVYVLPVAAGLWLAYRLAAHYLQDLFELHDFSIAARYLWPSLFGLDEAAYPRLSVDAGSLDALPADNPVLVIGGPGHIRVHLGFAVVLEDLEGRSRVCGPTPSEFVQGFERIREVIDLRDQAARVDQVRATTRDGIEVLARDVQMVFHVARGAPARRALGDPYPFDEPCLRRLVYARPVPEAGRSTWTEALPRRVTEEIERFVEQHTLEQFLAMRPHSSPSPAATVFEIPRENLTARFHTPETTERLRQDGLELEWVGVGTWSVGDRTPDAGEDRGVGQALISAWRERERLELYTSPEYLGRQKARGYREVASASLREWLEAWVGDGQGQHSQVSCLALTRRIREQLEQLREDAVDQAADLPPGYDQVIHHLRTLSAPHWLGRDS